MLTLKNSNQPYYNYRLILNQVKRAQSIASCTEWRLFVEQCFLANMLDLAEVDNLVIAIKNRSNELRGEGIIS